MPSERLITLLRHARASDKDLTWRGIAAALGDLYHPRMTLADVMHHLAAAYAELLAEPRFEVQSGSATLANLLLAPVKGCNAIDLCGPQSTDHAYTVEAFYNSIVGHILGRLMMARIDWCAEYFAATVMALAPAAPAAPRRAARPLCRDCADEVIRQGTGQPICPRDGQPCGF